MAPPIRVMTSGDEDVAVNTIVLAFSADPMARWSWPGAAQYLASMPALVRGMGGAAFSHGTA